MLRLASLAVLSLVAIGGAFAARLGETPVLPATPYDYDGVELPGYLDVSTTLKWDTTPAGNPITDAGATLGRVLFYDVRLSQNGAVSCASCHRQDHGFADPDRLSAGFEGEPTARNAMALSFPRYDRNRQFFWDERAQTLEQLALEPIQDLVEMGLTLDELTSRLEATAFYPDLFADAFGTPEVTSDRVARALSQFVRSIGASRSRYDAARQAQGGSPGRPLEGLTDQENQGLELFFGPGRCEQCHTGDLFMGKHPTSNGLDPTVTDPGAGNGRFKIVSLRNIALTAPYMHDGRFETLDDVVRHYDAGIESSPGLDLRLRGRDGQPLRMGFNAAERAALVAFLHTLTDSSLATDPRWADPFPARATADPAGSDTPRFDRLGPDPVRDTAAFRLRLAAPAHVQVDVVSATGLHVATLLDGPQRGEATVRWDATSVAPGTYVARLRTGGVVITRTVTVSR